MSGGSLRWAWWTRTTIWYLIAGTENGQRTFRVDRIAEAEVTDEPAARPPDFDLSEAWQHVVDEVEELRGGLSATVLVEARFVHVLRTQLGRHCEELGDARRRPGARAGRAPRRR